MSILVTAAAIYGVWWVLSRTFWYRTKCRRCKGTGRNWGSNSNRWGDCKKCHRTGQRLRWGARSVRKAIGRPL